MDRVAWQATVRGVAKSQMRLSTGAHQGCRLSMFPVDVPRTQTSASPSASNTGGIWGKELGIKLLPQWEKESKILFP